ncbi:MAG TPA: helix-turn-helix domain-containing protein [Candidatus Limosilactobacillus merdigallinarum]|uniref:Helix-turn-helix domain-containing protein n=1 Tax=Candidatus Limosilactobacillus merdigallinarum TaxID=2838652 RepID=A0A9D1VID1_9LACO|nr:helix-turn-helix domain-containing protein [Candidatus Limosilactobacillus merdigallinarum]
MDKTKSKNNNRIKEVRLSQHKTQKEVGKAVGKSDRAIAHYEKGIREPKLETWVKLADYFKVPVSYLQGLSEVNYRDEDALRAQFNSSDFAKRTGIHLTEKDKPVMDVTYLSLMQRDIDLSNVSKLKDVLFNDIRNIASKDYYQQLHKQFNQLSEKQISTLLFEETMLFALYLQDGNDEIKDKLYRLFANFYDENFR